MIAPKAADSSEKFWLVVSSAGDRITQDGKVKFASKLLAQTRAIEFTQKCGESAFVLEAIQVARRNSPLPPVSLVDIAA